MLGKQLAVCGIAVILFQAGLEVRAASPTINVPPPPGADWTRLPPVEPVVKVPPARSPAITSPSSPGSPSSPDAGETEVAEEEYWFWPYAWIDASEWDGGLEVGLNGTDGNSEAFTIRTGGNLKRKTKIYAIGGDVTYLKTTTNGVESQHRLLANSNYERFFGESRWSYFLKSFLEYDEFKAFDVRLVVSTGLGYQLIRDEHVKLKARFGAGAQREFGGPDDDVEPEAAFGSDYDWILSDRQKFSVVADYYPQWDDFNDYRLVSSLNWEFVLDQVANLSLKLSVSDRYDSTPFGRRPNDVDYGLLLLWKI